MDSMRWIGRALLPAVFLASACAQQESSAEIEMPEPIDCSAQLATPGAWIPQPYMKDGVELYQTFTSNGVTSSYHVFAHDIDYSKPVSIVVRLHGDGAGEFDMPDDMTACLAEDANQHNAIYLLPKTPEESDDVTWWEDAPRNREWLGALLEQKIYPQFGLSAADSYWMGYSGGAEMLGFGILSDNPEWVGHAALMVAGGAGPEEVRADYPEEMLDSVRLAWVAGRDDDGRDDTFNALGQARDGAKFYRSQGFTHVSEDYPDGYTHGNLPHAKLLDQLLSGRTISVEN